MCAISELEIQIGNPAKNVQEAYRKSYSSIALIEPESASSDKSNPFA
jgi:hypothetical protein